MLVAAPLLVIVLLTVERPSAWAIGLVAVTIPIEPYVATIHRQPISVLLVTLVVANIVVEVEDRGRRRPSSRSPALVRVLPYALVLLLLPVAIGVQPLHELLYVLAFLDIAWLCAKVGGMYPDGRLLVVLLFVGSASLQALVALAQYVTDNAFNLYGGAGSATYSAQSYFFNYETTHRTTGTFFDPISLGNVLAMALPLASFSCSGLNSPAGSASGPPRQAWSSSGGSRCHCPGPAGSPAAVGVVAVVLFSHGDQRRRGRCSPGSSSSGRCLRPRRSTDRPSPPGSPRSCTRPRRTSRRQPGDRTRQRTLGGGTRRLRGAPGDGDRFRQPGGETRGDGAR